ncbi:ribosome silencing factor [soil metagenome]
MSKTEPARAEQLAASRAEQPESAVALATLIATIVDEKLGTEIVALNVRDYVDYTDFLVVATARNERQVKAIHDDVQQRLKHDEGLLPRRSEGLPEARWVLLDYLECVLHIFVPETRELYRLDRLWGEAPRLELGLDGAAPA